MRNVWNVKYNLVPPVCGRQKKKKKKGNPGGFGGKLKAHNLVIWLLFQQDPTVNSEKLNGHNTE